MKARRARPRPRGRAADGLRGGRRRGDRGRSASPRLLPAGVRERAGRARRARHGPHPPGDGAARPRADLRPDRRPGRRRPGRLRARLPAGRRRGRRRGRRGRRARRRRGGRAPGLRLGPRGGRPALLAGPAQAGRPSSARSPSELGEDRPGPRRRRTDANAAALRRRPRPRSTTSTRTGSPAARATRSSSSHDAFGYLARYGLEVEPIAGLSPDAEPTPADLARLQQLIRDDGITTVFSERWRARAGRRRLADDMGVRSEVLDPIEGLSDETADEDYLSLMREQPGRPRGGERMSDVTPAVELTDGAVAIGGRPILRGIDLDRRARRVRGPDGRQRLRQVDAGARPDRPAGRSPAATLRLFGTPIATFHDWSRIGFVPQRGGAGVRRTGLGLGGRRLRAADPPPAVPAARRAPTGPRSTDALEVVGPGRQGPRRRLHPVRRPAAARADRAGPGRRAGPVLPRRADRRRRPAQPAGPRRRARASCQGARRHDRAGRPRARPAGAAGRPRRW